MEQELEPFLDGAAPNLNPGRHFGGAPGPPKDPPGVLKRTTMKFFGFRRLKLFFLVCLVAGAVLLIVYYAYLIRLSGDGSVNRPDSPPPPVRRRRRRPLTPHTFCRLDADPDSPPPPPIPKPAEENRFRTRNPAKVLVISKTSFSSASQVFKEILTSHKIGFKSGVAGKNLPDLIKSTKEIGKFGAVFFEDFKSYLTMDRWNRELLDKYLASFGVGIVAFVPPPPASAATLTDARSNYTLPFVIHRRRKLTDIRVNATSNMLRIVKGGQTSQDSTRQGQWAAFKLTEGAEDIYSPVAWSSRSKDLTVVQDHGGRDQIPKVLFGIGRLKGSKAKHAVHWTQRLLVLDALGWVSGWKTKGMDLKRYLMIDVDDVFVGKNRLTTEEVDGMISSQERIGRFVPGFKYNLGFSGATFKTGTEAENAGDEYLIEKSGEFSWFPHDWQHMQPHAYDNVTDLVSRFGWNKDFAEKMGIPVSGSYAVSPHHSGIYPVHEQLYESWRRVWGVEVTSTEEYPHLYPARLRKGFQHASISVLPRQTCGLFTKNLYYDEYPGTPAVLEASIRGGELLQTLVNNPISIFMTHMPNYGFDRLSSYTFESVLSMARCWTNLRLKTAPPKEMARIYFELFPEEKMPVWGNPCEDDRHMEIWSDRKSCSRLPDLLVVGPQKTGTTALYRFLKIHPSVASSLPSLETFEEVQFFSDHKKYGKGIDWYMDFFPPRVQDGGDQLLFEKSATYFDRDDVPERAYRLLKTAKIVAILISPSKRAYSWYHHARAHEDPAAVNHSFYQVITANSSAPRALRSLQSRCLEPGKYASHVERWLTFYPSTQLTLVDGEELKYDPISVMNRLQQFLSLKTIIDYSDFLKFDKKKGFYCQVHESRKLSCLGKGKGRDYPPLDDKSAKFLQEYYRLYNEALLKLMKRLGYLVPSWLEDDLRDFVMEDSEFL